MHWYVVHTKPRQEHRALLNLTQQGYECYLPLVDTEKLRQNVVKLVQEPLFSRYLFIRLDTGMAGKSWGPIRSTIGVCRLVTFGYEPAKVDSELIEILRTHQSGAAHEPVRLFQPGEQVQIKDGPFAGLHAIYQMGDGESRAMVLIEILSKPSQLTLSPASLRKTA
jgi:transcriptional antiterminator RfaH